MESKESSKSYACGDIDQNDFWAIYERLVEGAHNYVRGEYRCVNQKPRRIKKQKPYAAILSCADSRVDPERLFDAGPGELFVTRVAGNVATDEVIASLEYAVHELGTRFILVIGHESCGAVEAALNQVRNHPKPSSFGYNLDKLLAQIRPAVIEVGLKGNLTDMIMLNTVNSGKQLLERSPLLTNYSNQLVIMSVYYEFTKQEQKSTKPEEFVEINQLKFAPLSGPLNRPTRLMKGKEAYYVQDF